MKNVLITGANSYIGDCIKCWFAKYGGSYNVEDVDTIDGEWKKISFSAFDTVIHVAGIVHLKEKLSMKALYDEVNGRLPADVAQKAKTEGVKHFIFMSTKGVYTPNTPLIDKSTSPIPTKLYGKSKLMAEHALQTLESDGFHVSILRPPTVYGEGCKGNFHSLEAFSHKHHIFPKLYNKRSMIYIWNLCEFIRRITDTPLTEEKVLFPQNKEQKGTLDILEALWNGRGEKYRLSAAGALAVRLAMLLPKTGSLKTTFKDTVYSNNISSYFNYDYCVYSFEESIKHIIATEAKTCQNQ